MVLLPIFLIVLVDIFALTLIIPLLAIYAETMHATPLEATLLISTFSVFQLISGPLLGRASDRVGRKPLLIVSQIGTCAGLVLMAKADALWILFAARALDGATAGNLTLAQASIADNTPPEKRARAFALIGIAFGLGFFIGPFVTAQLTAYGLTAPIWFAAGLSAFSVLLTIFLLPNNPPKAAAAARLSVFDPTAFVAFFRRPELAPLLFQFFFYIVSFSLFTSGFALFAERRFTWEGHAFAPREIGYLFAYIGFLGVVLQGGLIGRLVKRFGEARLVRAGFVTLVGGYLMLGLVDSISLLLAAMTIGAFGNGVLRPALTSLVSRAAGADEQGAVLGLTQSLSSIATIVAPPAAGFLIQQAHLTAWAWLAAAASLLGLAPSLLKRA